MTLRSREENGKEILRTLLYFANAENVWYTDATRYDGINHIDNECIFSNLEKAYKWADPQGDSNSQCFERDVFYLPRKPMIAHRAATNLSSTTELSHESSIDKRKTTLKLN